MNLRAVGLLLCLATPVSAQSTANCFWVMHTATMVVNRYTSGLRASRIYMAISPDIDRSVPSYIVWAIIDSTRGMSEELTDQQRDDFIAGWENRCYAGELPRS